MMPEMSGFDVLERLKADPATDSISVIVSTSLELSESERRRLGLASAILSKNNLDRERTLKIISEALSA